MVGPGLALKVSTETVVNRDLLSSSVCRGAINLVGIMYGYRSSERNIYYRSTAAA